LPLANRWQTVGYFSQFLRDFYARQKALKKPTPLNGWDYYYQSLITLTRYFVT
jgi:exonuclease V gamma subunit